MKTVLLCIVAFVMVVQLPREGDAVCCYGKGLVWNLRCKDCSKATPFCSKEHSCNIFGCNCKGGCREGPCPSMYNHHMKPVDEAPAARDYESSYENGREMSPFNDYDVLASDVSSNIDSEVIPPNDYDVPASDVSSDIDSEVIPPNVYDVPAIDVSSDIDSEVIPPKAYDDPASSVPEVTPSNEYDVPASDVSSDSDAELWSSSVDDTPAVDTSYGDKEDITSADDVISTADENGDGYMDIDEAESFLVKRGLAASGYRAKRSLRAIDLNNDNFISAEEIELYED